MVSHGAPTSTVPPSALMATGLVTVERDATGPSQRRVRLTVEGARLQAENIARLDEVERDWRARYGAERLDALRSALERIVQGLGDELPDHLLVVFAAGTGFTIAPRC